ncbi:hypothetical protein [Rhodococcus opacus]|uniref:hypothetical protein n=1 Tax=Rhodococcus opacus TaxID=37919 RepID=UPI0024755AA1|nr:hypothetical protein [Rhodococcus opacus]
MQIVEIEHVPDRCPAKRSRQPIRPRSCRIIQCGKGHCNGVDQSTSSEIEIRGPWLDTCGPHCEIVRDGIG